MKYMVDFDNNLRADVKYQAAQEKISMNDLIIKALEQYLKTVKGEK